MKKCSYCGAEYPDDATVCAVDQTPFDGAHLEEVPKVAPATKFNPNKPLNDQHLAFQPILAAYRRSVKVFMLCVLTGILTVVFACATGLNQSRWLGGLFLLCMAAGIITFFRSPRLLCPACSANACSKIDHYCPECGGSHLTDRSFLFGCRCSDCGKQLKSDYTVHFCTTCGAYLHEKGFRVTSNPRNF
jgi:predicted amidophosphoribosyltransferase